MQGQRPLMLLLTTFTMVFGSLTIAPPLFAASGEQVLYSFCSASGCPDGDSPVASLIFDAAGNLYSTTQSGGTNGWGTVFELTPGADGTWIETVLHNFNLNGKDGAYPTAGLVFDAAGNLYGTTSMGGPYQGTIFELTPGADGIWTETILHNFNQESNDGAYPEAGLIFDAAGNLYGTTVYGGTHGGGTVFQLAPRTNGKWTEKVLHSFNGNNGSNPLAGLIFDATGNLYGTTQYGGAHNYGTVFQLAPGTEGNWHEKVLHSFNHNGKDGNYPYASLISDATGNFYGTTSFGGVDGLGCGGMGCGTVFQMALGANGRWTEKVLHNFGKDGENPTAGLIFDAAGNLYSTTTSDGTHSAGSVFQLTPGTNGKWTKKVLHSFHHNGEDGFHPNALIFDVAGNLYGTTYQGGGDKSGCNGYGCGTVFEITP